ITGGKVPSYLGSSFAFIGVVIAASGYGGQGPNIHIGDALVGIIACGVVYFLIGVVVQAIGTGWFERFLSPAVIAAVVAVIVLYLMDELIINLVLSNLDM